MTKNKSIYVIQRKDGMFYYDWDFGKCKARFTRSLELVFINKQYGSKHWCEVEMRTSNDELINCKPVRVDFQVGEHCDQLDASVYSMNSIIHTLNSLHKKFSMLKDYCKRQLKYFEELGVYGLTDEDKARKYTTECFLKEIERLEKEVL